MPLETIIIMLAIPVVIVALFNLDLHRGSDAPKDGPASDEAEH